MDYPANISPVRIDAVWINPTEIMQIFDAPLWGD